jgi:long-chain fatty acid transport protein
MDRQESVLRRGAMHKLQKIILIALSLVAAATNARAAGFYIQEQSVKAQGAAFAGGAANPVDAATVFFNPAGLTALPGATALAGVSVLIPRTSFSNGGTTAGPSGGPFAAFAGNDGGNPFSATPVPSLYAARPFDGGRYWLGLGVTAPFGLANDYDEGWFGRYDSVESKLTTVNFSPVFAMRVNNRLSIGGGPNLQYADARLENALPCPAAICGGGAFTPATDGRSVLEGEAWALGFNIGALWQAGPATQLGLHYRSRMKHEVDGNVIVSGLLGPLAAGNGVRAAHADLNLPDILSLGAAHQASERLKLLGSANWFGWSDFREIRVTFDAGGADSVTPENYDDSYSVALGAEWLQTERLTLRTGLQYDQTPTVDSDRSTVTPDGDRYWVSLGASYALSDRLSLDVAASHIFMEDGEISTAKTFYPTAGPLATTVNTVGTAENGVTILSLQAVWKF